MRDTWKWFFQADQKANIRRFAFRTGRFARRVLKALLPHLSPFMAVVAHGFPSPPACTAPTLCECIPDQSSGRNSYSLMHVSAGSLLKDSSPNIMVALRNQLKQNRLPNTPVGFPVFLQSTHSRQAGREGSEFQSGEFYQEVYTSGSRTMHMAKISFLAPHKSRTGMLQWTISVPAPGLLGWKHDEGEELCKHYYERLVES